MPRGMNPVDRAELEATGPVRVEQEIEIVDRPCPRFHPTLPYAAAGVGQAPAGAEGQAALGSKEYSDACSGQDEVRRMVGAVAIHWAGAFGNGNEPPLRFGQICRGAK
jgi:hypothetical protein